jgi:hypothetical protein
MRYDPTTFERRQPVDDATLEQVISQAPTAPSELLPCPTAPYLAAPSAPDVPGAVGGLIAASYVTLIGTLAIATTGSSPSIFAIVIAAFFVGMFFAVPRIFFAVEPKSGRRPRLGQFIREGMDTATGHSGGAAALVQMLVVPICLTLGVVVMGVIVAINF